MTARLVTDQMATRAWMRRALQPQAQRLAYLYWWQTYELDDARVEMRLAMSRILNRGAHFGDMIDAAMQSYDDETDVIEATEATAIACSRMDADARAFADEVLEEAIEQAWDSYSATANTIKVAVGQILRTGAGQHLVTQTARKIAMDAAPMPPVWLVQETINQAAKEYRFESRFWQQRARRAG